MSALDDKKLELLKAMLTAPKSTWDDPLTEAVGNDGGALREVIFKVMFDDDMTKLEMREGLQDAFMAYFDKQGKIEEAAETLLWHEQQAEAA